jgi:hypothetical protein
MAAAVPGMNWAIPSPRRPATRVQRVKARLLRELRRGRIADTLQRCDAVTMSAT